MDDRGIQNTSIAQGLTAGSDTIGDPIRNCYATRVGSLKVTGDSTLANATVNGTLTSSGTTLNGATTINGGATFNNSVNIADNPLTITGTGTLDVAGLTTLANASCMTMGLDRALMSMSFLNNKPVLQINPQQGVLQGSFQLGTGYGLYNLPYSAIERDGGFVFRATNSDDTIGSTLMQIHNTPVNTSNNNITSSATNLADKLYNSYGRDYLPSTGEYVFNANNDYGALVSMFLLEANITYKVTLIVKSTTADTSIYLNTGANGIPVNWDIGNISNSGYRTYIGYLTSATSNVLFLYVTSLTPYTPPVMQRTIQIKHLSVERFYNTTATSLSATLLGANTLNVTGNVGIGTLMPLSKLHVADGDNTMIRIGPYGNVGTAANITTLDLVRSTYSIAFAGYRDARKARIGSLISSINRQNYDSADRSLVQSSDLAFYVTNANATLNQDDNTTERMRIKYNGNVGIGTTDPLYTLDVSGTMNVTSTLGVTGRTTLANASCTSMGINKTLITSVEYENNTLTVIKPQVDLNHGSLELGIKYGLYNLPYGQGTTVTDGGFTFRVTNSDNTNGNVLMRIQNTPVNTSNNNITSSAPNLAHKLMSGDNQSFTFSNGEYVYNTRPNPTNQDENFGYVITNFLLEANITYKVTLIVKSTTADTSVYLNTGANGMPADWDIGNISNSGYRTYIGYLTSATSNVLFLYVVTDTDSPATPPLMQRTIQIKHLSVEQFSNTTATSLSATALGANTLNVTGNVGIGTLKPSSKLHVADGDNTMIRIGPHANVGTAADLTTMDLVRSTYSIAFSGYRDARKERIGSLISSINRQNFGFANRSLVQSSDLAFYVTDANATLNQDDNTTERMRIKYNGNVGIGYNNPSYLLDVNGQIRGTNLAVTSDRRIKTNIVDVEDDSALQLFRRLKPKTYTYRDTTRVTEPVYGFIAQEVGEVLNYATSISKDAIPNIYENVALVDDLLTFTTFNTSDLARDASGTLFSKLKIKTNDGRVEYINILEVLDTNTLKVDITLLSKDSSGNLICSEHPFVYGQEVDDFHNLNKDAIWTVATAALQEVDRQLQAEKQKTADLQTTLNTLLERVLALEQKTAT